MNIPLTIFAILPGLVISYIIIKADRYEKESKLLMVIAFFIGGIITYPAMKAEAWASTLGWEESGSFIKLFLFAVLFVGLIEELSKFVCLIFGPYLRKEFNEPLDGIVYSVLVAMGFATLENVIYADRFGFQTATLRAFTAVPAHAAFGVIMGYFVGLSKTYKDRRYILLLSGLGITALVHGIYDFFILQNYAEWLMSLATLVLIISLYFSFNMVKKLQRESPFRPVKDMHQDSTELPEVGPEDNDILLAVIEDMEQEEE